MAPRAGIVVVHFGDSAPTLACLRALAADPSRVARDVVVVDNSASFGAETLPGARVLSCPDNPGFGGAANRGVEALGAGPWDVLVVLNHDVEVLPGFLAAAVGAVAVPGTGAAGGPQYLDAGRSALWYAGGGVRYATGTVKQSRSPRDAARARTVSFIPGAALALAPDAWRRVGGFDPAFFLYNEDLDLCLRLRRLGFVLRFAPAMAAIHRVGAATGSAGVSPLYLESMARTRLLPFRPLAYRLYLALLHTAFVTLRAGWHAARRSARGGEAARALLRGHREALLRITREPLAG